MSESPEHIHAHPHPRPHGQEHSHTDPHADDHEHAHADHQHPHEPASSQLPAWESRPPSDTPTPLLYVDCFSGIAGDMLLGALLDAGLSLATLQSRLTQLDLGGYRLDVQTKQSYGITGAKLDVLVDETVQPQRRLADIVALLDRSQLPPWVRSTSEAVFRRLAVAEAKIHGSTVDAVHFHEVGAVDSIIDIVGSLIGMDALGIREIHASSLPLPGGTVRAQHGLLPAPAPATLEILAQVGAPTRPSPVLGELVTPTGAAILAELATFEQPLMRVRRVGYGYGTKELPWPNAVRVWLGERWAPAPPRLPERRTGTPNSPRAESQQTALVNQSQPPKPDRSAAEISAAPTSQNPEPAAEGFLSDEVIVIECNLDDTTPEMLGFTMEQLLTAGALDVYFSAIQMKKNRPGTLLGDIARPETASELAQVILRQTTTLGVRMTRTTRLIARRRQETVPTPFGMVRIKLKLLGDRTVASPEYEDCAAIARSQGVPLANVYRAAQLAAETLQQ
jgi:uncharacterized protein (TIGR00299 family) protein